jgi:succinoglycan biosynthesis transport protein ExoP
MELRDYLRVLRRGWPVVLAFVALGLFGGIGITVATTRVYEATSVIFVATQNVTDASQLAGSGTFVQSEVQSLTTIANSPTIVNYVANQMAAKHGTDATFPTYSPSVIADKISADAPLSKAIINLHATDHDPTVATFIAQKAASKYTDYVSRRIENQDSSGQPLVKLTVVHPAAVPAAPVKPNKLINIVLGFVIGMLLGVGVVILRDVLDNTVKGPNDFEALDLAVLGMVPLDKRTGRQPIAFRADPHSARSEAYRQLRTNLQFVNVDRQPKIIAVTSAIPGEGKTTTAMNLAAALADAGHRVILLEADLRRPNIAKILGLVPEVGFTSVLIGQVRLEDALQNAGRNLAVLTSGPIPPNPSELLISDQAKQLVRSAADQADYVIIDTAPLLPVADGSEVAAMADATVVVHRAGKTTRDQAARCAEALAKVGERAVGVVLNMISRSISRYDYEYSYAYSYRPERSHMQNGTGKQSEHADNGHAANGRTATLPLLEDDAPAETVTSPPAPLDRPAPTPSDS